jgi:quercetin dioxygenase-like cupin family protein
MAIRPKTGSSVNAFDKERRSFLRNAGLLGMSQVVALDAIRAGFTAGKGYVLGATEGENLVHFRDHGKISIKAGSATGSDKVALGTQQVMAGSGIPIHRHFHTDEAFYVLEGGGTVILDDVRHPFETGGTLFIPKNTWHGFENPDRELLLLWIVSPPGLDGFFRETCSPPGVASKRFTREQIHEIALKYGTEFR